MHPHLTTCSVQALQSETDEDARDAEDPFSERLPRGVCHSRGGERPNEPRWFTTQLQPWKLKKELK